MPLRFRSIPLPLAALFSATIALAQPQIPNAPSQLETLHDAHQQLAAGTYSRALRSFDAALDPHRLASWDPATQLTRIDVLATIRPQRNTERELARLIDDYASSPQAPYAQIRRGLVALRRGNHGQARLHFDEAVQAASDADEEQIDETAAGTAYYWLGIAHLTDRDGALHPQAAAALHVSADDFPRNPYADDALFALGQLHEEAGDLDSAIVHYNRLVERYPNSENRLGSALRAAQSQLRLGRVADARRLLADVRSELDRPAPDAERLALQTAEYHLLTATAEEQAGDLPAAERSYLSVVYEYDSPYRRLAMLGLADTYRTAGRTDSASAIYKRILDERRDDHAGMTADYQMALLPVSVPFSDEELLELQRIASDQRHALALQARLTLAGIDYLRQRFTSATALLDSTVDSLDAPALRLRGQLLRGVVHLASGRYDSADADLTTALRMAKTIPVVLLPERDSLLPHITLAGAIATIHAGRPAEAVPQLNRLLGTQPANAPEALYWLGEAYYAANVLPAAVQTMEDLIERRPTSQRIEDALYAIGWAQFKLRKLDRAEAAFARLVKAYPLTIYATAAHLRRGDCLYLTKRYAAASDAYRLADSAHAHADDAEYARYQNALALYHAEKRDAAGLAFNRFLTNHPTSELADDALFMVGLIDYLERRYADASSSLGRLTRQHPTSPLVPRALTTLSGAYYALGELDSARSAAALVVTSHPASAYHEEADAALTRAEKAIAERDKQRAREDERLQDAIDRARRLAGDGDTQGSIDELARIRSRTNGPENRARLSGEIADSYLELGDTVRALDALRDAAAEVGTEAGARATWQIAEHFAAREQTDSAAQWFRRAAAVSDSTAPLAHLRTGQSYLRQKRWALALDAFNRVTAGADVRADWRGEAELGIATVHAGQGDRAQAREIFERLIRDHAGHDISRRAEEQLRELGNL